nr:unnamed protein product [Digitaria exilis]
MTCGANVEAPVYSWDFFLPRHAARHRPIRSKVAARPAMSPAAAWCAQHRLRFLLPALFLAPVLYFLLSPPPAPPFVGLPASGYARLAPSDAPFGLPAHMGAAAVGRVAAVRVVADGANAW